MHQGHRDHSRSRSPRRSSMSTFTVIPASVPSYRGSPHQPECYPLSNEPMLHLIQQSLASTLAPGSAPAFSVVSCFSSSFPFARVLPSSHELHAGHLSRSPRHLSMNAPHNRLRLKLNIRTQAPTDRDACVEAKSTPFPSDSSPHRFDIAARQKPDGGACTADAGMSGTHPSRIACLLKCSSSQSSHALPLLPCALDLLAIRRRSTWTT